MSNQQAPIFPSAAIPNDAAAARLLGLYPQIQDGLWLQRVKILGGTMTAQQWHALANLARRFTPGTPLHLTTRQDIEVHDLREDQVPLVQQEMTQAGLTGLGACGDTLRNVTVCPCSGLVRGAADLEPLAWQIRKLLEAQDSVYTLPRKFKISLSACEDACGQPFINDLGLVAVELDGMWGFRVMAAGSLGPRPATGIQIFDWLPAGDVLPLVLAAFRVFAEHGDRTNRAKARLRHVRERMGNYPFVVLFKRALGQARQERFWPMVHITEGSKLYAAKVALNFLNGDVSPEAADALARLSGQPDTCVRISNHHQVLVFGTDAARLAEQIAGEPALQDAARPAPRIVACPGKRWCKHGLTDTGAMAARVREELAGVLSPDTTICISGCPNGCTQHAVADFGLGGVRTTVDGVQKEAYNLLVDGGMGRNDILARPMGQRLLPEQVIDRIASKQAQTSVPQ
jgi:sulfite reductase beta subunit-like hemoprotein